jgi:hypothetical protein
MSPKDNKLPPPSNRPRRLGSDHPDSQQGPHQELSEQTSPRHSKTLARPSRREAEQRKAEAIRSTREKEQAKDSSPSRPPEKAKGGAAIRTIKGTAKVVSFPFRQTLSAPARNMTTENDQVWSLAQWNELTNRVKPRSQREIEHELAEIDNDPYLSFWADPTQWPPEVSTYVRMNIQINALIFLAMFGLSTAVLVSAAFWPSLSGAARLSLLVCGLFGTFTTAALYIGACLDYARMTIALDIRPKTVWSNPAHYWVFDSEPHRVGPSRHGEKKDAYWVVDDPHTFSQFCSDIPAHMRKVFLARYQNPDTRDHWRQFRKRIAIVIAFSCGMYLVMYLLVHFSAQILGRF